MHGLTVCSASWDEAAEICVHPKAAMEVSLGGRFLGRQVLRLSLALHLLRFSVCTVRLIPFFRYRLLSFYPSRYGLRTTN